MPAKLSSIIAATDLSNSGNRALERAARLAAREGIRTMRVLHVLERSPAFALLRESSRDAANARRQLGQAAARIGGAVDLDLRVKPGRALREIAAESRRSDLLVIGASEGHALRDLLAGTTGERLLGDTPASILVARGAPEVEYRRVLVALDFSCFDEKTIDWARAVAPAARLDLMHVLDHVAEGKLRYAGVSAEAIEEYRASLHEQGLGKVRAVADRIPGYSRALVAGGPIASSVLKAARASNADLIVVGHRRRPLLARLILRRIAAQVLARAQSDVLVVH